MAPQCTVCMRPDVAAIDQALVARCESIRTMAHRLDVTRDSLMRHRAHVSPALQKVAAKREERRAERLLDRITHLTDRTEALLERADASGSVVQALAAVRELRELYRLLGAATGELREGGAQVAVLNVMASPELQHVITVMLDELYDQPDVRMRIGARLKAIDADKVLALPR